MSRVEINADGRHVIVDHVGDLPYLIDKAMEAWKGTDPKRPPAGFTTPESVTRGEPGLHTV